MDSSQEMTRGAIELVVLQTLSNYGDNYGYELIKIIAQKSESIFEFKEGTLYPLLYRLEEKKLVKSYRQVAESGKERRFYHITAAGEKRLANKRSEFEIFFKGMDSILKPNNLSLER
jgi:DNA-binding PadR family transcriptional regulator